LATQEVGVLGIIAQPTWGAPVDLIKYLENHRSLGGTLNKRVEKSERALNNALSTIGTNAKTALLSKGRIALLAFIL
jgi:hypothetical protein